MFPNQRAICKVEFAKGFKDGMGTDGISTIVRNWSRKKISSAPPSSDAILSWKHFNLSSFVYEGDKDSDDKFKKIGSNDVIILSGDRGEKGVATVSRISRSHFVMSLSQSRIIIFIQ